MIHFVLFCSHCCEHAVCRLLAVCFQSELAWWRSADCAYAVQVCTFSNSVLLTVIIYFVHVLQRIKVLLHDQEMSLQHDSVESCLCIPWDEVMFLIVEQIITHLRCDLWFALDKESEREFTIPTSWLRAEVETSIDQVPQLKEQVDGAYPLRYGLCIFLLH